MRVTDFTAYTGSAVVASTTSSTVDMEHAFGVSFQMVWTSTTAAFDVTLQVSNDGTTWINTAQTQAIANNNGSVMLTLIDNMNKYVRANIVRTSGTLTTLELKVIAKGL